MGGALPPALLCASLGLALAFAQGRLRWIALAGLLAVAVAVSLIDFAPGLRDAVFLACWLSTALTAASLHLPAAWRDRLAMPLALNAGAWTGAVVALAGAPLDLAKALPAALLALPGAWLVARNRGIVLKVVSSWLIAVALLAAALPIVSTPGYVPDHMD
ncbi:hypothetical protein [Phenylobacterium sp.]|uniref:hypothetical protein n=1 Tax=Phenylobacterium sp. TaxID=1871053 RepID=UPI003982F939